MSRLQDLFVSLESEEEVIVEDGDIEESTAYAILEVEEAAEEVEAAEEDIEELEEVEEGLESIAAAIEVAAENGGLDRKAAMFAHMAVGAYTGRYGVSSESVMVGLESFGGDTASEEATKVSLEGIGEQIKKIWNAIRAAVAKAIKAISDFFSKLFGGVKKLEERVKKLKADVKKLGAAKKGAKFTIADPDAMHTSGQVSFALLDAGATNYAGLVNKNSGAVELAKKQYEIVAATIVTAAESTSEATADEALARVLSSDKNVVKAYEEGGEKVLPGGKMWGKTTSAKDTPDGKLESVSYGIMKDPQSGTFSGSAEVDGPKQAQDLTNLLTTIGTILKAISDDKSKIDKLPEAREKAIKAGDKAIKAASIDEQDRKWVGTKLKVALRFAQADVARASRQLYSHSFSFCRSAVVSVERAMKTFEKK